MSNYSGYLNAFNEDEETSLSEYSKCDQQVQNRIGHKGSSSCLCCDLTFINPPESGVRAAVLQAGVLPFIHIYNVPVFSADGHGEHDEAEQPAQTGKDHNCPKVHLHQRENPSDDSLTLSTGCSHSGPLKPSALRHIKAHDSCFISPDVSRLKEEAALSKCWIGKL